MTHVKSFLLFLLITGAGYTGLHAADADSTRTLELDPVVVTGTRIERQKSDIPASISVVSRAAIARDNQLNILPLLHQEVPGLFVNTRSMVGFGVGPNTGGNISIRGISGDQNKQVLMLIDGQPQFMGIFGHPIGDSYMATDIERVEVIRGPAAVLYGSNAYGGAINLITRTPKEGLSLGSTLAAGSFGTQIMSLSAGHSNEAFTAFGAFNYEKTEGHRDDGNDFYQSLSGYLKLDYTLSNTWSVTMDGNLLDATFNNPGTVEAPRDNDTRDYLRGRAAFSVKNDYEKLKGAFMFFYNFGEHAFSDGFESYDYNRGLTFYQNLLLTPTSTLTVGLDYKNFGGKPENDLPVPPKGFGVEHTINETDVYAVVQQDFSVFSLSAAYRLINNSQYGVEHVPAVGITATPGASTTLKANVSKGFRSPAIVDLFLFPPSSLELEPERLWNYEVSLAQRALDDALSVEMTLFYMDGSNLIQPVIVSTPPPVNMNTGDFVNQGIELAVAYFPLKQLGLRANYAYLDTDKPLKYAPRHKLNLMADLALGVVEFSAGYQLVDDLVTAVAGDGAISRDSYGLLRLGIQAKATNWLTLFVEGNNLLDEKYAIDAGYPLPGANVLGGLRVRY